MVVLGGKVVSYERGIPVHKDKQALQGLLEFKDTYRS